MRSPFDAAMEKCWQETRKGGRALKIHSKYRSMAAEMHRCLSDWLLEVLQVAGRVYLGIPPHGLSEPPSRRETSKGFWLAK